MYGTVARMRVKPGQEQAMAEMQRNWDETRKPKIDGAVASFVFRSDNDPNVYTVVAVFRDRESYTANASDPDQDRWYQELRSHLVADPEWNDGEIVAASMY